MSGNNPSDLRQQKKLPSERPGKGLQAAKNGEQLLFSFLSEIAF